MKKKLERSFELDSKEIGDFYIGKWMKCYLQKMRGLVVLVSGEDLDQVC